MVEARTAERIKDDPWIRKSASKDCSRMPLHEAAIGTHL
jgi:hypothetical protein